MGSTAAQNLAGFLRERAADRFWVLGTDLRAQHGGLGLCDADGVVPSGKEPNYVDALLELAQTHRVHAVIPVMEDELLSVSTRAAQFERAGVRPLVSSLHGIQTCLSKRQLAKCVTEAGLPSPRIYLDANDASLPAFAKPDRSTGSRGATKLDSREQLIAAFTQGPGTVVTEFCDGRELSIDAFADENSRVLHAIARTRDEVRGGLVVRSTIVSLDDRMRSAANTLAQVLGLHGFFNLQCIEDATHGPRFTDLNPRLGGGMVLSFHAGLAADRYLDGWLKGIQLEVDGQTDVGMQLHRRWHNVILTAGSKVKT
jgi:carbamoyl-phosphate synthase large subunit